MIHFTCPHCGHQEKIQVLTVGWKRLEHICSKCATKSAHHLRHWASAGLLFIGFMACWGIAFTVKMAFDFSFDQTLLIVLGVSLAMTYLLIGKTVNACSSWQVRTSEDP